MFIYNKEQKKSKFGCVGKRSVVFDVVCTTLSSFSQKGVGGITKKGLLVQSRVLDALKEESPLSTRQLALKLNLSWHTVQQHCLHLFIKKKLKHFELAGSYIWLLSESKKGREKKKTENETKISPEGQLDTVLETEINAELQTLINSFLKQFKEKITLPEPKEKARENRTIAQSAAGGEKNDE